MNNDDLIISGFNDSPALCDFSAGRQLARSGSTCDAYECVIQRRRVFVKRLKEKYRDNPLYRAAFAKEYDLGITLSHPSLPRYVGFGEDYIAMDFIEGDTLADLMKRGDKRLANKRYVTRLLRELIDVVDYLHSRNIVHCDIKPDNIMISPYHDRPVTLIDLDKAYTSWLDDTSGNPAIYGCAACADGAIDFKGIGLIADKLNMKGLAKACADSHASADTLRAKLSGRKVTAMWGAALLIAVSITLATIFIPSQNNSTVSFDRVGDTLPVIAADSSALPSAEQPQIPAMQPAARQEAAIDNYWISKMIAAKSDEIKTYRQHLMEILASDSATILQRQDAWLDYTAKSGIASTEILGLAVEHHKSVSEVDIQHAVRSNPAWIRLMDEEQKMQAFLNEWSTTGFLRLSGHPASLLDTILSELDPSPHR